MQCPSCQFENMPGSGRCARCGGLLALASATIDVHPPRAGRVSRNMPWMWGRWWSLRRWLENHRDTVARPFRELVARFDQTDFTLDTMLRCIVPGWAHRYRGNPARGGLFFSAYIACLVPALLLFGTSLGSMFLGLAFATHVASAVDALVGRFATVGDRLTFMLVCSAVIGLGIYAPIGLGISRFAVPIQINHHISIFAENDVLWYNPHAHVRPGDYVLYAVPNTTLAGTNNHTRYVLQNRTIDRVAAVAGQHVQVKSDKMYVDNVAVPERFPTQIVSELERGFDVPEGRLFIPGDGLIPVGARLNLHEWQQLCLVPHSSVAGRIFFRSQPLWRMSTIEGIASGSE